MKTKKIIWGLLITTIITGCSTDGPDITEQPTKTQVENKRSGSSAFVTADYGMPFLGPQIIYESRKIEVVFHTNNRTIKKSIREDFSRKYSHLALLFPPNTNSSNEIWYLSLTPVSENPCNKARGCFHVEGVQTFQEEEEEDPINVIGERTTLEKIIDDIRIHIMISIQGSDSEDPDHPLNGETVY